MITKPEELAVIYQNLQLQREAQSHLTGFIQGIRLSLDGISLSNRINIQSLLLQFQGSLATQL